MFLGMLYSGSDENWRRERVVDDSIFDRRYDKRAGLEDLSANVTRGI
jgi:hypothetical protein